MDLCPLQQGFRTGAEAVRWLRESGLTPAPVEPEISLKPDFQRLHFIQDTSLFRLMGFREAVTLDYSDYEGAEIICNLSHPLPDGLLAKTGRFDLIVDAGCLEHIFNVPQVLENYFHLAGDRGVVILIVPSSNLVDHGFYSFSPTLFQDYYSANHWQILRHYFYESFPNYNALWKVYEYRPGALVPFAFIFVVRRKGWTEGGRALLEADVRLQKLRQAVGVLLQSGPNRAEQVQMIFSDKTPPPR